MALPHLHLRKIKREFLQRDHLMLDKPALGKRPKSPYKIDVNLSQGKPLLSSMRGSVQTYALREQMEAAIDNEGVAGYSTSLI
jgi:hypothetical protein